MGSAQRVRVALLVCIAATIPTFSALASAKTTTHYQPFLEGKLDYDHPPVASTAYVEELEQVIDPFVQSSTNSSESKTPAPLTPPVGQAATPPDPEPKAEEPEQTTQSSSDQIRYTVGHRRMLEGYIQKHNKNLSGAQRAHLAEVILQFSEQYNVDFRIVAGVIAVESSFRHDAVSRTGAQGLGQLKPATAKWLGVSDPFDPVDNIFGVTKYIDYLLNTFSGDLDKALSAYFVGPGTVSRKGITKNSRYYLHKINTALGKFN